MYGAYMPQSGAVPGMGQPAGMLPPRVAPGMTGVKYNIRPVTDFTQAAAIPPEFDGSITLMPDAAHGVIYTKQLNTNDGTAIFNAYKLAPPIQAEVPAYITLEQLQAALQSLSSDWEQKFAALSEEPAKAAGKGK